MTSNKAFLSLTALALTLTLSSSAYSFAGDDDLRGTGRSATSARTCLSEARAMDARLNAATVKRLEEAEKKESEEDRKREEAVRAAEARRKQRFYIEEVSSLASHTLGLNLAEYNFKDESAMTLRQRWGVINRIHENLSKYVPLDREQLRELLITMQTNREEAAAREAARVAELARQEAAHVAEQERREAARAAEQARRIAQRQAQQDAQRFAEQQARALQQALSRGHDLGL